MSVYKEEEQPLPYFSILICLSIVALLPFLVLYLYNHPAQDDYGFAVRDLTTGFIQTQKEYYTEWSGRFFSTAVARTNPLIYGSFGGYKLFGFSLFLSLLLTALLLLNVLLKPYFRFLERLALTGTLLVVLLVQLPDIAQGFYWYAAYMTYILPSILLLLLLYILAKLFASPNRKTKWVLTGAAMGVSIAILGANELSLVIHLATLLLLLSQNWQKGSNLHRPYLLTLFIFSFILSLAVVAAPGNYGRMSQDDNSGNLLFSIAAALFLPLFSLYKWGFLLMLSSLLYTILWGLPLAERARHSRLFQSSLPLTVVWYLGCIATMHFIYTWSTGERAGSRAENVIYLFFVLGWFYVLQVALHKYASLLDDKKGFLFKAFPMPLMLLLLLFTFDLNSNVTTAYLDLLSGRAATFDRELKARYSYLKSDACDSCAVTPVTVLPKSLYIWNMLAPEEVEELGVFGDFARYWGKTAVYLDGPTPPVQDNLTTLKEIGKKVKNDFFQQE